MKGKVFHPRRLWIPRTDQAGSLAERGAVSPSLPRGVAVGAIGGLVGTIIMDLFGAVLFLAIGGPASLSFSIIGDAAAAVFSLLGVSLAGGFPLGLLLHYLIGLALGAILGAALSNKAARHVPSPGRSMAIGIVYVEVMSQPMLATAAIVLNMTGSETAQWFGISFVMHLVYGLVLGAVASRIARANWAGKLLPPEPEMGLF